MASRAVAQFSFDQFVKQVDEELGKNPEMVRIWRTNKELIHARDEYFEMVNTNPCTRLPALVDAFNTISAYRNQWKRWLAYFRNPPFLDKCIPSMKVLAKRKHPILMIQNRYVPPPQLTPVDPNIPVKEVSLAEREQEVKKEKLAVDQRAGFTNILPAEKLARDQFICKKCGKVGGVDFTSLMTRKSDEASTVWDTCDICTQGGKT